MNSASSNPSGPLFGVHVEAPLGGKHKDEVYEIKTLPRESPTWKRVASAHWLRVGEVGDGIFQASELPPTKKSLASEVAVMKRRAKAVVKR
ncbi:uncharacterized protein A4U43_C05F34050 [Asparagus officinalis]|uniref:Uncharacterized protein n=1 Tax=Asparagus officinalis TaxID=4686 RepID=A0A5P1F216_ASPOF|nr:uncharacterized protein A4U43_C05F34050 [Asparagus officinalis]